MPGAGSGILKDIETGGRPEFGVCAAVDMHYLGTGGARAAVVRAAEAVFVHMLAERTAVVPRVAPYRPGEFYRRELPPLRAVLAHLRGLGLLVVDGYTELDPGGRPGLGASARRVGIGAVAGDTGIDQPEGHSGLMRPRRSRQSTASSAAWPG